MQPLQGIAKKGYGMRTILGILMWVYFLPGLILGAVKFGMQALQSAMAAPEPVALAESIGVAAVQGGLRMLYWLPSVYEHVVVHGVSPLTWLLT